ncbi:hypothetical protein NPIL_573251 [Nephila pilipes]|uniref:Golgin-84 n=1 Tax=Nephila pilipes TaxID=299642 RepID=A0A8X6PPD0_NEPPI|nr:hypothetical protein NPIL_573251 [Nephila pilipes]
MSSEQIINKIQFSCDDIRLGVFFRRYPITRVFVFVYMLLLHFWVMIVLLTYEPEIHNASSYEILKKQ